MVIRLPCSTALLAVSRRLDAVRHKLPFLKSNLLFSFQSNPSLIHHKINIAVERAIHAQMESRFTVATDEDMDEPMPGNQFAQFGAGCFWGVELAFQRIPGVTRTEVGYSQGITRNPTYVHVCQGTSNHNEVVRVQYDTENCSYQSLLAVFWAVHDPTELNHQGNDVGNQYRSGIYYYNPDQEKVARCSMEQRQEHCQKKIVTEILPAKQFYRAEEEHQQYLARGGRHGVKQSAEKGCSDPIRCYG